MMTIMIMLNAHGVNDNHIEVTMMYDGSHNHIGEDQMHCAATWCQFRKPIIRNNHDDDHDYAQCL